MRQRYVQINMVVSSGTKGPQLMRVEPSRLFDCIEALYYPFKKFWVSLVHKVFKGPGKKLYARDEDIECHQAGNEWVKPEIAGDTIQQQADNDTGAGITVSEKMAAISTEGIRFILITRAQKVGSDNQVNYSGTAENINTRA